MDPSNVNFGKKKRELEKIFGWRKDQNQGEHGLHSINSIFLFVSWFYSEESHPQRDFWPPKSCCAPRISKFQQKRIKRILKSENLNVYLLQMAQNSRGKFKIKHQRSPRDFPALLLLQLSKVERFYQRFYLHENGGKKKKKIHFSSLGGVEKLLLLQGKEEIPDWRRKSDQKPERHRGRRGELQGREAGAGEKGNKRGKKGK